MQICRVKSACIAQTVALENILSLKHGLMAEEKTCKCATGYIHLFGREAELQLVGLPTRQIGASATQWVDLVIFVPSMRPS
jgi:hypothetical protein